MRLPRSRAFFLLLAGAALALVLIANAHLVYVASTSQPACVPHARADGDKPVGGAFGAARPSC
ncbi:hypothetical protein GCM10007897_37720 [Sphingobium jiangsuense]|uniref:Uncharacterized protein n=1 Tax=Sphingobium jiangsuense TaxID=870476 RepID=A0A7W6FQI3_9SPHN|nr:hypothetical protein [Sphingobium jiangsuense]MBB3926697.1 hypothetical protein [Sphingobium jiangsuense]GLT02365.1 hypothetical protein GCM10007897_37720 [Sphingobium jiangsuense]